MAIRHWKQLSSPEFAFDAERTVALLPVAAVEQHGPHLPVGTDALVNAALVAALEATPPAQADVVVLPAQETGHSLEHAGYGGTVTHSAETLLASWQDLARAAAQAGLRKLVLLNTHGGNSSLVNVAALRMRAGLGLLAVRANYFAFGAPPGLFDAEELRCGLHGGEFETSLMLHLHPGLVRREALADFRALTHELEARNRWLGVEKPVGFGWLSRDVSASGVSGNAARADAARGGQAFAHLVQALRTLLDETAALPLSTLRG